MKSVKLGVAFIVLVAVVALMASSAMADARINVVDHFGGDALYCNQADGCWALNADGNQLWSVPQADIDSALQTACDSGVAQHIEAGNGTYGAMTLVVTCPDSIILVGYDEWDKQHVMNFTTDYLPLNPPNSVVTSEATPEPNGFCEVDLAANGFNSVDGIHHSEGFDIWSSGASHSLMSFQYWSATSAGYPDCNLFA